MCFLCKIVMYNKAQRPTQRKAEAVNGAPAWSWLTLLAHAAFSFSFTLRRLMSRFIARKQSSAPASATFLKKCTCMIKHRREGNAESQSKVHSKNTHADTVRRVGTLRAWSTSASGDDGSAAAQKLCMTGLTTMRNTSCGGRKARRTAARECDVRH
jgi:hypothetical protein